MNMEIIIWVLYGYILGFINGYILHLILKDHPMNPIKKVRE